MAWYGILPNPILVISIFLATLVQTRHSNCSTKFPGKKKKVKRSVDFKVIWLEPFTIVFSEWYIVLGPTMDWNNFCRRTTLLILFSYKFHEFWNYESTTIFFRKIEFICWCIHMYCKEVLLKHLCTVNVSKDIQIRGKNWWKHVVSRSFYTHAFSRDF